MLGECIILPLFSRVEADSWTEPSFLYIQGLQLELLPPQNGALLLSTGHRTAKQQTQDVHFLPILVELNGKVCHVLQSFVGEVHFHIDVPLAVSERA